MVTFCYSKIFTIDQTKLAKFHVCNQHLLCPFCAGIRASKAIQKYTERVDEVLKKNRKLKPVLITLTVKNGTDLSERSAHLIKSLRTLIKRRQDYNKKGRGFNEFCKINGAMYSYENTYNEKQVNGIRMFICLHCSILGLIRNNCLRLGTKSQVILLLLIFARLKDKDFGYSKAAAEVCKYALKFGDLSVEHTWKLSRFSKANA